MHILPNFLQHTCLALKDILKALEEVDLEKYAQLAIIHFKHWSKIDYLQMLLICQKQQHFFSVEQLHAHLQYVTYLPNIKRIDFTKYVLLTIIC